VDQLGFATRKLGHEGHHDPVFLDLRMQLVQALADAGSHQVVVAEPFAQQLEPQGELPAPGAVFIQFVIECHGYFPVQANIASRAVRSASAGLRRRLDQGFWHTGHQKVERCPWRSMRTGVAHTRQGWPARPYTMASSWK